MNHGKCFQIADSQEIVSKSLISKREQVLNPEYLAITKERIDTNKSLLFLSNDVSQSTQKQPYRLILHGILPCGSKTTVTITGIYPLVDIIIPSSNPKKDAFKLLQNSEINFHSIDVIKGKPFMGYQKNDTTFVRVQLKTLFDRKTLINICKDYGYYTYSNDKSSYHRVVARRYEFNLAGWNILTNYGYNSKRGYKSKYSFEVDIENFKPIDPLMESSVSLLGAYPSHVFKYAQMILASFDIEMMPFRQGHFPDADKCIKDEIFMICMTFHMVSQTESVLNVCLSLKDIDPMPDMVTIVCANESVLIASFAKLVHMMQPDFITEFNGSGFDWRNIITKVKHFQLTPFFIQDMSIVSKLSKWETNSLDFYAKEQEIKVDGSTANCICKSFKVDGYINFDTMVVFKQLDSKAESFKLNECLKRCNLGSKDDLPVEEMFRIYRSGSSTEMKEVAHYCLIDTVKLQSLLLKKNVIIDRREIALLSMTSLYDAFYYANGGKIRNLLMNLGEKKGYMFDTSYRPVVKDPEAKFPGAFVVPPKKGIVRPILTFNEWASINDLQLDSDQQDQYLSIIETDFDKIRNYDAPYKNKDNVVLDYANYLRDPKTRRQYPVSGLDYSSLYPSLIMTYNISPERLITDPELAATMAEDPDKVIHYAEFEFIGDTIKAWFVDSPIGKPRDCGLCPTILIDLFAKRAAMKKIMKPFHKKKEHYEIELVEVGEANFKHMKEYNEACFDYNYYDSKQKALKVFMNTFYGEMGNFISFICAVECAGSVTTLGRHNLIRAKDFVESKYAMDVHYGDTDSLYISCNSRCFDKFDLELITGRISKEQYGTAVVEKTFEMIETIRDDVNQHLKENNGRDYLKMAYEEVLYPVVFVSKKKYFGIPHEDSINFFPKTIFMRGLEIVKRGVSDALKDVCYETVVNMLDINSIVDTLVLIDDAIKKFFSTNWEIKDFAKTAVYRPDKKNPSVLKLIARYLERKYDSIPEPNVRFKYVICKILPWIIDYKGKQINLRTGDRMELLQYAIDNQLEIDIEYYFNNEITGQLARFISFYDMFDTLDREKLVGLNEKEYYKKIEENIFNKAKKYIIERAGIYSNGYKSKPYLMKSLYTKVVDHIKPKMRINKRMIRGYRFPKRVQEIVRLFSQMDECLGWNLETCNANLLSKFSKDPLTRSIQMRMAKYLTKTYLVRESDLVMDVSSIMDYIKEHQLEPIFTYNVYNDPIFNPNVVVDNVVDEYVSDDIYSDTMSETDSTHSKSSTDTNDIIACIDHICERWIYNVVVHLRDKYIDFETVYSQNSPINYIEEVIDRKQIREAVEDPSLYFGITEEHATQLCDIISNVITKHVKSSQMIAAYNKQKQ